MAKRRLGSRTAQRKSWFRIYRFRIITGQERCRACGRKGADLTFHHILPSALGGRLHFDNSTILCPECNQRFADKPPNGKLISLADEELKASPEKRWAINASITFRQKYNIKEEVTTDGKS